MILVYTLGIIAFIHVMGILARLGAGAIVIGCLVMWVVIEIVERVKEMKG
jgi:hypothetical protein